MITAHELLVIDDAGEKRGVMSKYDALRLAEAEGLDLVEVAPMAKPPVVKLMDFGKYKYQEQKKAAEARKHQHIVEVKEIKLRPMHRQARLRRENAVNQALLRRRRQGEGHAPLPWPRNGAPWNSAWKLLAEAESATPTTIAKGRAWSRCSEGRQMVMVIAPKSV
jgi:translation initiation factor IF-3